MINWAEIDRFAVGEILNIQHMDMLRINNTSAQHNELVCLDINYWRVEKETIRL